MAPDADTVWKRAALPGLFLGFIGSAAVFYGAPLLLILLDANILRTWTNISTFQKIVWGLVPFVLGSAVVRILWRRAKPPAVGILLFLIAELLLDSSGFVFEFFR